MTYEEALEHINRLEIHLGRANRKVKMDEALTVCKEALQKQIPTKVNIEYPCIFTLRYFITFRCPICNGVVSGIDNYCRYCGQHLDMIQEDNANEWQVPKYIEATNLDDANVRLYNEKGERKEKQ